jgi:pyrimidine operon attenuation protein/uracil phosphoribosyltransferase
MIHWLHQNNPGHGSGCKYCNYQQLRNAIAWGQDQEYYRNNIVRTANSISEEIVNWYQEHYAPSLRLLLTNIATNSYDIIQPVMDHISTVNTNVIFAPNLMIKIENQQMGRTRSIPCEEKFNWVQINEDLVNANEFDRVLVVDDILDSGCSIRIAEAKILDIGFNRSQIDFLTILRI